MRSEPGSATVSDLVAAVSRPAHVVVTAGMPYANGPLHLGHLAGAHVPADIFARYMGMVVGRAKVLFVCGTDDHGSTSEVAALRAGVPIRDFIDGIHAQQERTLARYGIDLDVYTGTSSPECLPIHQRNSDWFIRRLLENGMLEKRSSEQWFDPELQRFLPDRLVRGRCPNPKCSNEDAWSDECGVCGKQYPPSSLLAPRSALSDATPVMKATTHWWLDMWKVGETLRTWIVGKEGKWRPTVMTDVLGTVLPALRFEAVHEAAYKELKATLPPHRFKYAPGKAGMLQFNDRAGWEAGRVALSAAGIPNTPVDDWAHRAITRDVAWGLALPDLDPDLRGKTLYVWPDSLIAPISFSEVALLRRGEPAARVDEWWRSPDARIYQFLGQDNVYFYVLMQGALWLGTQADPQRMPVAGELQLTDVFGCAHLQVGGEKMSKSRGNFYTADELLERGYDPDQVRYFLAVLGLGEKSSNFEFATFDERNRFLAGPLNAAFERPISACHSKFGGRVPEGVLLDKVAEATVKMVRSYLRSMERAEFWTIVYEIENYARLINSLFTQYKPHDDRQDRKSVG